jgi:hypothetical protein
VAPGGREEEEVDGACRRGCFGGRAGERLAPLRRLVHQQGADLVKKRGRTPTPIQVNSFSHIPVTGSHGAKTFTGHFNVVRFVSRGGKTYALGTLTGTFENRTIKRLNVAIPVLPNSSSGLPSLMATSAAVCPILHLNLGPLNLTLLGLNVHLNEVVLDITAVSGPGNLLGNLLCSVAHLLDQPALGSPQTAGLLNILQQLTSVPGLTNL